MQRNEIFYIVLDLLKHHKDLQCLPERNDLPDVLSSFFTLPEVGRLGVHGVYRITSKHIFVRLWSNKEYRFSWKQLTPKLRVRVKQQYLF